jgi:hypothetical protein
MLTLRGTASDRISVRTARSKIHADIVVIPGKIGCVVLDLFNSDQIREESALFIFHDPPNLRILAKLESRFMEINGDDDTSNVKGFKPANAKVSA